MRLLFTLALGALCAHFTAGQDDDDWVLVFEDEFEGTEVDRTKWSFDVDCWGGGNAENQCYIDDPSTHKVENGIFTITPVWHPSGYQGSLENCTNNNEDSCEWTRPATSAKVVSSRTGHAWRYGRFEMRSRMPVGDFFWPAWWMMPLDSLYGGWAASGEIDILEFRGQERKHMEHTIHYGGEWPDNQYTGSGPMDLGIDFTEEFVVYALEWEEDSLRWFVNGQQTHFASLRRNFWSERGWDPYDDIRQPFDQRFFLIINLAIGGNFFNSDSYGNFDARRAAMSWEQGLEVDYVRVWQRLEHIKAQKSMM